jgi:hypothetical protein
MGMRDAARFAERGKLTMTSISVPVVFDEQRLRDLMCSAVEGGSNYWARFYRSERTPDLDYLSVEVVEEEPHSDDTPRFKGRIKAEDLARGLELLGRAPFPAAAQHLANFLSENDDAETADVVLQMTVFGELIYG